jgi:hypothetical protein
MQMQTAMIMMAVMGCDDSGTRCVQLSASQPKWETVSACDKASEKVLESFSGAKYPMIIAICQTPQVASVAPPAGSAAPSADSEPAINKPGTVTTARVEPTLAEKTIDLVKKAIPTTEGIKSAFQKPVHVIADGYSWVAQKFHHDGNGN